MFSSVLPPSSPTVTESMLVGNQVSLVWTQPQTDLVAGYDIQVATAPCVANVATLLPGSGRFFLTDPLEEFSTIIITLTANNTAGERSAPAITIQTPPASMYV